MTVNLSAHVPMDILEATTLFQMLLGSFFYNVCKHRPGMQTTPHGHRSMYISEKQQEINMQPDDQDELCSICSEAIRTLAHVSTTMLQHHHKQQ